METFYTRKTEKTLAELKERAKKVLTEKGLEIVAEKEVTPHLFLFYLLPEITKEGEKESAILALNNWVIWLKDTGEKREVGTLRPEFVADIVGREWASKIKSLIDEISGEGKRKPSKVILYATMTCPYCKMEQAWLKENNIEHELVYVDLNHEKAHYMIEKTGQQGVPQTQIIFEDGTEEWVIGFNKPLLEELLLS